MKRFVAKHSPLFILAGLCLMMALWSADFRSMDNLTSVAYRTSVIGIIAVGELLVILIGAIDLSVGSLAALAGVVSGLSMKFFIAHGIPCPVALGMLIGMAIGLGCGIINGVLITVGRIPAFIVTLGMMMVARGEALILSGAKPVFGLPPSFAWLGGTRAWWIPVALTLVLAILFAIVLAMTRFGRALYAIGGNLNAARLSGLRVDAIRVLAFSLCGLMAGFAGVMLASRTSVADPNAADSYELDAIAGCVIGGASLMGGEGGAIASLAGALIMMVLRNFCNLENINVYWQKVFVGALVVLLVFYDNYRKRKAGLLKD